MAMFEARDLTPVQPVTIIPISEIKRAFRLIQGRKHIGKIVLEAEEAAMVKVTSPKPPPLSLDRYGTYVIAGGLGDLGRHIARFLATHGAGHIILLSRRYLDTSEQDMIVRELKALGAETYIMPCDVTNSIMVNECVNRCRENLPPLKGVIQAPMILQVSIRRLKR